jgi:hypothetical protein
MDMAENTHEIGMVAQSAEERERFESTARDIVAAATADGRIVLRLLGSLAFNLQCKGNAHVQAELGRAYTDIDFAGYSKQARYVTPFFEKLGFNEDREVNTLFGGTRMIFNHPETGLHVDVFFDKLNFCHDVDFTGRLELDSLTIPRSDLILEKMQIVKINEKDIIDTIMMLLEYPWTESDTDGVDLSHIAAVCAGDWGWWRTLTMNLGKVDQLAQTYDALSVEQKLLVAARVHEALERIETTPKSKRWKMRSMIGDRKKWYQEIDAS